MTPALDSKTGILLLLPGVYPDVSQGHIRQAMGSFQARIAEALGISQEAVLYGCMEQGEPTVEYSLEMLCAMGLTEIRMLPMLFFPDTVFNQEIPRVIRQITSKYPGVRFQMGRCLGVEAPELMDLFLQKL
jgi:sirohydrochlorin ferrochelatase